MLGGHTPAASIRAHVQSIAPTEISERETLLCTLRYVYELFHELSYELSYVMKAG